MSTSPVFLCASVRTPIGNYGGSLKDIRAPELGSVALRESLRRAGVAGSDIDTVILGQVVQAGSKMNPARQAAVLAGIPVDVPAMTVNRVCGSGAQAAGHFDAEIVPVEIPGRKGATVFAGDEHSSGTRIARRYHQCTRRRSRMAIPSAPPAPSSQHDCCTPCTATR